MTIDYAAELLVNHFLGPGFDMRLVRVPLGLALRIVKDRETHYRAPAGGQCLLPYVVGVLERHVLDDIAEDVYIGKRQRINLAHVGHNHLAVAVPQQEAVHVWFPNLYRRPLGHRREWLKKFPVAAQAGAHVNHAPDLGQLTLGLKPSQEPWPVIVIRKRHVRPPFRIWLSPDRLAY